MELGAAQIIILLVAAQRIGELLLANRNTKRLLAAGGREVGAAHYPLFPVLHTAWLVIIFLSVSAETPLHPPLLLVFLALQLARVWIIASLGRYWTTRIITLPGAPLVRRGPFRYVRHPNYLVVAGEIAVLPLAFGLEGIALVFSLLNAALLAYRIKVEEAALADRRRLEGVGS